MPSSSRHSAVNAMDSALQVIVGYCYCCRVFAERRPSSVNAKHPGRRPFRLPRVNAYDGDVCEMRQSCGRSQSRESLSIGTVAAVLFGFVQHGVRRRRAIRSRVIRSGVAAIPSPLAEPPPNPAISKARQPPSIARPSQYSMRSDLADGGSSKC